MSLFDRLGGWAYAHWRRILLASALLFVTAIAGLIEGGRLAAATIVGLEADLAVEEVDRITGRPEATTLAVVVRAPFAGPLHEKSPFDPAFIEARERILQRVRSEPGVEAIATAADAPALLADRMRNKEARAELVFVTLRGDANQALQHYPAVRKALRSDELDVQLTGNLAFVNDLAEVLEHDLIRAELISLPLALLVLLLVFRTAVAAALPVMVGTLAVVSGIAVVMLLSHWFHIAQYTINVCSLIGFGVAIDYSLFLVSRYRDELAKGHSYQEALSTAVATAGRAVAYSGLAVGVGLAGLFFFEGSYLSVMGMGGSIVVAFAVLFALTVLPATLAALGPRIHKGKLPGVGLERNTGFWHRLAHAVMKRPVLVLIPTLALLAAFAGPVLGMRLAATDVSVLPEDTDARRGVTALMADFPSLAEERLAVVVRFPTEPVLSAERIGALYDLGTRIKAIPGIAFVEGIVPHEVPSIAEGEAAMPVTREDAIELLLQPNEMSGAQLEEGKKLTVRGNVTVLYAILSPKATPAERDHAVLAIRSERAVFDGTLSVGGKAAHDVDSTHFMVSRAPRAALFVIGVTLLVVFVMLRSVLLPIKAVAMNVLSIGATFGVLVWLFQDGHLFVEVARPLEPTLPVLLFCVSFGLSMDYEVLMLARMKEAFDHSGDNATAVAEGLERSAGLVTSAAAIMVSVFSAFALAHVVVLQATGVGLALAVALDATLIRALLVPATMRLLGAWNWWAPKPLRGAGVRH